MTRNFITVFTDSWHWIILNHSNPLQNSRSSKTLVFTLRSTWLYDSEGQHWRRQSREDIKYLTHCVFRLFSDPSLSWRNRSSVAILFSLWSDSDARNHSSWYLLRLRKTFRTRQLVKVIAWDCVISNTIVFVCGTRILVTSHLNQNNRATILYSSGPQLLNSNTVKSIPTQRPC